MDFKDEIIDITPYIHQAALDPHISKESLDQICAACIHYNFSGLCTNLNNLKTAKDRLGDRSNTKLIAVIGFPFGSIPKSLKQKEAEWAADHGAQELDVVPNFYNLTNDEINYFAEELASICEIGLPVRSILDTTKLSKEKLSIAVEASLDAGVRGLQNGNGFGPSVNRLDIKDLSQLAKGRCEIKAVGGVRRVNQVLEVIEAGANKIGTSFGPSLMKEYRIKEK